ncbi:MAG: hypothetical protein IJQ16_06245, partial [Selenomonadaceae bacterium]|nr:hypothetical protein [Selenomonadaceae bacterium]
DAEDSNYKIPQDIIDNPLEWLGPLPEKYQKKADNENDDWFLDFVKKSGMLIVPDEVLGVMPFAPPPPKNYFHHKPKKKSPSYSNKFRKKRK